MSPTQRVALVFTGLEVAFVPFISAAFIAALGIDEGRSTAITLFAIVQLIRYMLTQVLIVRILRPIERWRALPESRTDKDAIFDAAQAAYRAPYVFSAVYVPALASSFPILVILLMIFYRDTVPLDPHVKPTILMMGLACFCGPAAYAFPTIEFLLVKEVRTLSVKVHEEKIPFRGSGVALGTRFMFFGIVCCSASMLWLSGISYLENARGRSRLVESQTQLAVEKLATAARTPDPSTGQRPTPEAIVHEVPGAFVIKTGDGKITGESALQIFKGEPSFVERVQRDAVAHESGKLRHIQSGVVAAYQRIDPTTVIGIAAQSNIGVSSSWWAMQGPFFFLILTWAPIAAWLMSRSSISPIQRVAAVLEEIRNGRVEKTERVAVYHYDETGKLSQNVNGMLDVLRTLSAQARSIASGDLSTTFSIGGDLGDAFRAQLESLRTIVGHMSQSAIQLSAAATELYAASQEQETAAGHQSAGVNEVGKTMETLLTAAAHISDATQGVLSKAERTRETTERTAQKIGELSSHAGRIGEILDVIREIADRSDLLALNASLEGTRAGEAGRGFALVAAEMRKLAERVMASVHDIKQLVADVRASVASTIMVTEESSKLADGTTESARQISLVTQQQSSGTEQAAQSMRDVAAMLTQSLSATQQMRTLAANLKGQAEQLSGVVARFRITNGVDGPA
jgi:methyl-accepting chemotaxis protein